MSEIQNGCMKTLEIVFKNESIKEKDLLFQTNPKQLFNLHLDLSTFPSKMTFKTELIPFFYFLFILLLLDPVSWSRCKVPLHALR